MPTLIPADERLLPPPESLEIAQYAIGWYLSELDNLLTSVRRETERMSLYEYVLLRDSGVETSEDDFDKQDVLGLIAFAADAMQDAESIRQTALKIQAELLAILHEMDEPNEHNDPKAWQAYKGRISAWHRAQIDTKPR